jgi:hypothetical protein
VLGLGLGWDRREIDRHLARGQNHQVHFDRKIPIHITYFTAYVDDAGKLAFRNDLYGQDRRLMAALNGAEPLFSDAIGDPDLIGDIPVLSMKRKQTQIVENEDEPSVLVNGKKKKRPLDGTISRR